MIDNDESYVEEPTTRRPERGFPFLGWLAVLAGLAAVVMGALWLGWPVSTGAQGNLFALVVVALAVMFAAVMGYLAAGSVG